MEEKLPIYPSPPKQERHELELKKYLDDYFNKDFIKKLFA